MKKKQLLAFMMAGALSVSVVPYSAFAEEGAAAVSIDETAVAAEAPAEQSMLRPLIHGNSVLLL